MKKERVNYNYIGSVMGKFLRMLGYLILLFLVLSNNININLSDAIIILLGILSAIFMSIGIFVGDKKNEKNKR